MFATQMRRQIRRKFIDISIGNYKMCPMSTITNISLILSEGESYKVEFKEQKAKLDREIVAFANASGGSIFLGVNDQSEVVGIEISNKLMSEIHDIARNCDPSIRINLVKHKAKVLEVQVEEKLINLIDVTMASFYVLAPVPKSFEEMR